MDLLTVIVHELGHILGNAHDDEGVTAETLDVGERYLLTANDASLALYDWAITESEEA